MSHRDRQRSRSRSRSPDRYHHKHRSHRDKDTHRDRNYKPRDSHTHKVRNHNNSESKEAKLRNRNRLIASRSQSVLRSQSTHRHTVTPLTKPTLTDSDNARAKPKFLTRKQREQIALQKLNEKRALQRESQTKANKERQQFYRSQNRSHNPDTDIHMSDRNKNRRKYSRNSHKPRQPSQRKMQAKVGELQLIKDQYLGKKREKKSIVPPSQKFKFNFDWEISEDTSEDLNELYSRRAKVGFCFGRGYIAGMDRDEQRKKNELIWKDIKNRKQKIYYDDIDDNVAHQLRQRKLQRISKENARIKKDKLDARNWRDKNLAEMTERDWRILKEEFRISTKFGGRLPNPIRFWRESGLPKTLLSAIKTVAGYDEPYKIQRMAIPVGLSNRDCVGIAETGSGKTAAFVLPMLVYVLRQPPMNSLNFEDGPYALVLAPTRELARQTETETNKFATYCSISAITIVGGIDHDEQSNLLRNGVEVIIATPGRLLDCIDRRILVLNQCNYVVLDEADRMIDMGFEPQVNAIFEHMPSTNLRPIDEDLMIEESININMNGDNVKQLYRQTFMFSATMPAAVERLTRKYLRNPVYITIGDPNATANEHVKQHILWTQEKSKRKTLQKLLNESNGGMEPPIMVFVNMKKNCDTLAKFLRGQQWSAISLHGGKSQQNREYALAQFKAKEYDVLVCTNVAGRGIDIENVQHVINYDMPNDIRDYCHRIGRTGRAGQQGTATSFLTKEDTMIMYDLKKMLLKTGNKCPTELMHHEAALRNPNLPFEPKTTKQILAKVKPV